MFGNIITIVIQKHTASIKDILNNNNILLRFILWLSLYMLI